MSALRPDDDIASAGNGKANQAAATHQVSRVGQQQPGFSYGLWETAATVGMASFDPPEIIEHDLSSLLLDCQLWGGEVTDPDEPALAERGLSGSGVDLAARA